MNAPCLLIAWLLALSAPAAADDGEPPDLIVRAGRIWTGDPDRPWAEAVATRDGVIVALGGADEVLALKGPNTKVVDRSDGFATPGLIDAHGHLSSLGGSVDQLDLRGTASPEKVAEAVANRIASEPGDGWITGRNWDQSLWTSGQFPTAAMLDVVAPDRPVWLRRVDGHAAWANAEAMRRAGVSKDSKAPSDGQILRDSEGRPTGVFVDGAMGLIERVVPSPTADQVERRLLAAQQECLRVGLTGVHDAGVDRGDADAFRKLDREGKLKLRVYAMASPPSGGEVEFVDRPPPKSDDGSRFQMRAIKLFADGAMGSRGALLFEPYADDPASVGLALIDPATLKATTEAALRNGWQVCTHAIGDKGNALVLDAYLGAMEAVPGARDPRLRVEHAQVVRREDVSRFAQGKIIASMQPSHASTDQRWADARLGPGRVEGAYAWRWFADAGVPLAFGSDFPVEIASPFWGLYAAVSRLDEAGHPRGGWHPNQLLTMHEALRGFTAGAAYAEFAEGKLGVLKPGMRADLTVIDRNLFRVTPDQVRRAKVTETIIDGEVVYSSP